MKAFLLIALTFSLFSCTKPKDLQFIGIQNIRMLKWGLSETLVGINARFYNPNHQQVQLKDADAAVYVNGTFLGNTLLDSTIHVPRNDTFSVPLVLKLQTISAISRVMQSLSDSTVAFKVEGKVKMGKAGVFVTYPLKYEGVQKVSELSGLYTR